MNRVLLFIVLITANVSVRAQNNFSWNKSLFSVEEHVVVDPMQITEDWRVQLQHLEMPKPGGTSTRAQLIAKKAALSAKYPVQSSFSLSAGMEGESAVRGLSTAPISMRMFEGNLMQGSVPNDNDVAISNEGFLVSVINSNILMYDVEADTLMTTMTLAALAQPLGLSNSKFDPKIVYDPMANRFVMVFLNGASYNSSRIIIGFSTTSNPTDPWNMYKLSGNPLLNNTWSDYPVIGISNADLFIGVNTFYNGSMNNSGFVEGTFWQVALVDGYAGDTLRTAYYHDITAPNDTLFNITPIACGAENLNLDMFLLSNKNLSSGADSLYILHITEPLANGNPQLEITLVNSTTQYRIPPPAQQPNGHFFDTNDSRILGGFQSGGKIQFVQSCMDTVSGLSCIYHGMIDDVYGTPTANANLIVDTNRFIGYPNIAWTGTDTTEARAIITFNYVSPTEPGGTAAVIFQNDSSYSDFTTLKTGLSYVNVITGTDERWGDYSGIQRKYNETCKVWTVGTFGKSTSSNGTWIAEVAANDTCAVNPVTGISTPNQETYNKLYPNPVQDLFTVEFDMAQTEDVEIILVSLDGKQQKVLLNEQIKKGRNSFGFSTVYLSNGIYVLQIKSKSGIILSKRVVKAS